MNFLETFRGRLLIILALLLIATIGFQYYLNLRTQQESNQLRELQEQALVAGFALAFSSITSKEYLEVLVQRPDQPFYDANTKERIREILVINDKWQIIDSLSPEHAPTVDSNNEAVYVKLGDLRDLPPLMEANRLGADAKNFPNAFVAEDLAADGEAHAIPIDTSYDGRWYAMVVLKNDKKETAERAARPLIYTLLVLTISSIITLFLVWRFTRPIAELSNAARAVASGDLSIRIREVPRRDELGELAVRFNEMTAELEKKQELEAMLKEAEKSAVVGRLGSAIAHEIRNPLNYINLTLDHLRAKFAPADGEQRADFEKLTSQLKSEVARINQQIGDFLSYSRPPTPAIRPTDIRKAVEDSLRIVEVQAEDRGVRISVVEHENVPPAAADPEYLRSLFNNLMINAVQSMESAGGMLTVKIMPDDRFVRIEIIDTGCGISESNRAKIFEPYFSTKETGTGLGLAIVQKIVDVHHGTIEVDSKVGEGTRFVVRIPAEKTSAGR
jgi:signal transduction histidine kinase